ncbi:hypothetical protein Hypma_001576 [Hypsizygus marmoreus]|uniref:Uncharacterized protein n=1 Tax=Hypsizygus marmoreus TaxID=39966 RepID=A0A369K0T2_HYPMA|nr:hypothetical protein Hypma_001576 [Hypsizygus marmoreus]
MDERLAWQGKDKAMTASFKNQMHELEAQLKVQLHENETMETELTDQILQYEGKIEQLVMQNEDLHKKLEDLAINFKENLAHKMQEMVAAHLSQPKLVKNEALHKANEAISTVMWKAQEEKSDLVESSLYY